MCVCVSLNTTVNFPDSTTLSDIKFVSCVCILFHAGTSVQGRPLEHVADDTSSRDSLTSHAIRKRNGEVYTDPMGLADSRKG